MTKNLEIKILHASQNTLSYLFQKRQKPTTKWQNSAGDSLPICPTEGCGKQYHDHNGLLIHQFGDGHLTNYCCVCDKTYCGLPELRRHIKSRHLGESFKCALCDQVYNRDDSLRRHQMKTHGMILCKLCGSGFTSPQLLRDHVQQYHPNVRHSILQSSWIILPIL